MNERINELAEQAGYIDMGNNHTAYIQFDHEKFAELIVRECVTKIALEVMNNSWIDDAVKNTYEHFGLDQ